MLCCHRLAAMGRADGVDFVRLPHREMEWAPVPIRCDTGIAAWRPGWLCPGCAQTQGGRATVAGAHCAGSLTVSPDCLPETAPPGARDLPNSPPWALLVEQSVPTHNGPKILRRSRPCFSLYRRTGQCSDCQGLQMCIATLFHESIFELIDLHILVSK